MFKFVKKIIILVIIGCLLFGGFYGFKEMFSKQNPPSQVQTTEKLSNIQNLQFDPETRRFSWNGVVNADGYKYTLTIGDNAETAPSEIIFETTYTIPQDIELAGKSIVFKIYAVSTSGNYANSDWAEISYNFPNN